MTVTINVWTIVGITIELFLVLVLVIFVRLYLRLSRAIRSQTENTARATRIAKEEAARRFAGARDRDADAG